MPAVSSLSFVPSAFSNQTVAAAPVKTVSVPSSDKSGDQSSPELQGKRFWPEPSGYIR